jgi:hypothetical protein
VTGSPDLDALRDAAALTRAVHEHDHEARETILCHGDTAAIAEVLARVLAHVLHVPAGGCEHCVTGFLDDWQADLRENP